MVFRPHPKYTDPVGGSIPNAWATCDRCGFVWDHKNVDWQFDWRGAREHNLRILICPRCKDNSQRQLGVLILPPDPDPIKDARIEPYDIDES